MLECQIAEGSMASAALACSQQVASLSFIIVMGTFGGFSHNIMER